MKHQMLLGDEYITDDIELRHVSAQYVPYT